jgi:hypothetical protein
MESTNATLKFGQPCIGSYVAVPPYIALDPRYPGLKVTNFIDDKRDPSPDLRISRCDLVLVRPEIKRN